MKRFALFVLCTVGFLLLCAILFLTLPVFSTYRGEIASKILVNFYEGESVQIGDARLKFSNGPTLALLNLSLTARDHGNESWAYVETAELSTSWKSISQGQIKLETILIDGLTFDLFVDENGVRNWIPEANRAPRTIERQFPLLTALLSERNMNFVNSGVRFRHVPSGFDLDFNLKSFTSRQRKGETETVLAGLGTINGKPFEILGHFPDGPDFGLDVELGTNQLKFLGVADDMTRRTGFSGDLSVEIASITDFLGILRLRPVLEGSLIMNTSVLRTLDALKLFDLQVTAGSGHHQFEVTGQIENLLSSDGGELFLEYVNVSQSSMLPGVPDNLMDITIQNASTRLVSFGDGLLVTELEVNTNVANPSLRRIGPVSFDRVFRTNDGKISVEGVEVFVGSLDDPVIHTQGEIGNLLDFSGVSAEGRMNANLSELPNALTYGIDEFGTLRGSYRFTNAFGPFELVALELNSDRTDLWDLSAELQSKDLLDPDSLRGRLDFEVNDLAQVARVLNLKPTPLSNLGLNARIEGEDDTVNTTMSIALGRSNLTSDLDKKFTDQIVSFVGQVASTEFRVDELTSFLAFTSQLSDAANGPTPSSSVQPIWLDDAIQPLMLDDPFLSVDAEDLAKAVFADIDVDFKRIVGIPGVPSLRSKLELQDGIASLQPVTVSLPTGYASVGLFVDTLDKPDTVRATGQLRNVSLQEVSKMLNIPVSMTGSVSGDFNGFANYSSLDTILDTLYARANLTMGPGTINTSLIKLAGLGVIPWLFSPDFRQGYSNITCVSAPLVIQPGRVFSNGFVLETPRVQVVTKGTADHKNNRIAIHAEPRRVGQPLSRSYFPVEVYGELTAPRFRRLGNSKLSAADAGAANRVSNIARQPCKMDKLQWQ